MERIETSKLNQKPFISNNSCVWFQSRLKVSKNCFKTPAELKTVFVNGKRTSAWNTEKITVCTLSQIRSTNIQRRTANISNRSSHWENKLVCFFMLLQHFHWRRFSMRPKHVLSQWQFTTKCRVAFKASKRWNAWIGMRVHMLPKAAIACKNQITCAA